MTVQFSSELRERFIAPGVSEFDRADIEDMSSLSKSWVSMHFLNCSLRGSFVPPMNAYAYNFLRRVKAAFYAHELARVETLKFLANPHQSANAYAFALFHWETFLAQSWHALELLGTPFEIEWFKKGDKSSECARLNALYNQMKHTEQKIEQGRMIPGATVPVWLTNDGLKSVDSALSYRECEDTLRELAQWADALVDPRTAREKIELLNNRPKN